MSKVATLKLRSRVRLERSAGCRGGLLVDIPSAALPCLDLEVPVYARLGARLGQAGIRTLLPAADRLQAVTKGALPLFCYENGIATPRTQFVPSVRGVPLPTDPLR